MSIASEITRIQNAKSALKTSINAKTDSQHQITNETIDDYADFVDSITSGGEHTGAYKVSSVAEMNAITDMEDGDYCVIDETRLPSEYQEIEYLKGTGTQYIDTNYYPYKTMGEIKFKIDSTNINTSYIASVKGSSTTRYFIVCYNKPETIFNIVNNNTGTWYSLGSANTNPHIVLCNDSTNKVYFDGVQKTTIPDLPRQAENSLCLFALNNQGTIQDYFVGRIYYLKLTDKETNTVVRNMIPAKRISDSVAGMYDLVNNVFYTNAGTGTFTIGNNVYHQSVYRYNGTSWVKV